jgi:RNA polymerase sigma-70 factor, ECF subfamily
VLLGDLYRAEHARVLSSVLARIADFPIAEESVQDAFAAAAEQWRDAPPANPRAWLVRVASNKAIDRLRRRTNFPEVDAAAIAEMASAETASDDGCIPDERLRLLFTCCHPALSADAQVALTLRTVAGLRTDEVARLFFLEPAAIAQRLVRAQRKIRDARIPYVVPAPEILADRAATAFAVLYLAFTEGYAPSRGEGLVRAELCDESIRLARLAAELLPNEPEAKALLALMLLHDARREARFDAGELVVLEEQDRSRWNRSQIDEALALLDRALAAGAVGPYALQAAIAGLHARARDAGETDWKQILGLYEMLVEVQPTAVVELNHAVALAMARGANAGLAALDRLRFRLDGHHLFHAARADLLRRLGRTKEATRAYRAALKHVQHPAERRFVERRLAEIGGP